MARITVVGLPLCALLAGAALAACSSYSSSGSWLRYAPSGPTPGWAPDDGGKLAASLHGASVSVDLGGPESGLQSGRQGGSHARIEVVVRNTTGQPIEIRLGAEGTSPQLQIGEYLQRPVRRDSGGGGPDYAPYSAMQAVRVESGWRTSFFLDSPLGREPSYGQYFVFTVEARLASGAVDRRSLPLVAKNPQAPSRQR